MSVSHLSFPIVSTQKILNMSRSYLLFTQWLSKYAYFRYELSTIVLHNKRDIFESLNVAFYHYKREEEIRSLFLNV